jgi:hypothetical protein
MSGLHRRLRKLEAGEGKRSGPRYPCGPVPVFVGEDHPGPVTPEGERITWDEYERRFPDAAKPLRWYDPAQKAEDTP